MIRLVVCSIVLATITHVLLLRRRAHAGFAAGHVQWVSVPYRSLQPIATGSPWRPTARWLVQLGAWSSLVSGFVLVPGLGWAMTTLPLGSFTPVVAMWMGLSLGHLWCGHALLCGSRRALQSVRTVALATMAIALPLSVGCLMHLASLGTGDHDPCVPSLRTRLLASLVCIAHALLLLLATRGATLQRESVCRFPDDDS